MDQTRCLGVSLSVLTTWTVLELTGIPLSHQLNVAGCLDHGLVDGGSVSPQTSPTTTSPEMNYAVINANSSTFMYR